VSSRYIDRATTLSRDLFPYSPRETDDIRPLQGVRTQHILSDPFSGKLTEARASNIANSVRRASAVRASTALEMNAAGEFRDLDALARSLGLKSDTERLAFAAGVRRAREERRRNAAQRK